MNLRPSGYEGFQAASPFPVNSKTYSCFNNLYSTTKCPCPPFLPCFSKFRVQFGVQFFPPLSSVSALLVPSPFSTLFRGCLPLASIGTIGAVNRNGSSDLFRKTQRRTRSSLTRDRTRSISRQTSQEVCDGSVMAVARSKEQVQRGG